MCVAGLKLQYSFTHLNTTRSIFIVIFLFENVLFLLDRVHPAELHWHVIAERWDFWCANVATQLICEAPDQYLQVHTAQLD